MNHPALPGDSFFFVQNTQGNRILNTEVSNVIDYPEKSAHELMRELGHRARAAAGALALASTEQKNDALRGAAAVLREHCAELLEANALDVGQVAGAGRSEAFVDRLRLDASRVEAMARALEEIAELPDPVGRLLMRESRPNGLEISRVATPIGVIGMIFESRPNVGADAGGLCLKSGNAVILRGGSESFNSTRVIVGALKAGLEKAGLPADCVQMVGTPDRAVVSELLRAVEYVDLVIPRGGHRLVSVIREEARVPTLLHLEGNCHTYVHAAADLARAVAVVRNAKLRRTGICGATESLVIDDAIAEQFLPALADALEGCELRGDARAQACDARVLAAAEADWDAEYLDAILSIRVVSGPQEAFEFISAHSSGHTDAILTEDAEVAEAFLNAIDSAVVMHNTSTQFADGGEFGMGAEIGIATGRMHARGPVGLEQLTTFKYQVRGAGQVRA